MERAPGRRLRGRRLGGGEETRGLLSDRSPSTAEALPSEVRENFRPDMLALLLIFGLLMAALTIVFLMSWNLNVDVDTGAPADVHFMLPRVSWVYYALFTGLVLAGFVLLLKRLLKAWKKRSRHVIG